MALTRKLLKGMGLTDEQVDTIIEAHTDTVDGLKEQVKVYKADADKLPTVQQELDDLKEKGDDGYKEKYEKEHSDFEAYKSDIAKKETRAAKEAAVKAYYESKGGAENPDAPQEWRRQDDPGGDREDPGSRGAPCCHPRQHGTV